MTVKNVTVENPQATLIIEESLLEKAKIDDKIKTIIVTNKDSVLENIVIK